MKKLFLVLFAAGTLMACNQSANKGGNGADTTSVAGKAANAAIMKFEEENFDFGKVTSGEKVTHAFKFTNTGKSPMIITNATASCGCTVPEWPKAPVLPGKDGVISVVFNSEGKSGLQDKQITVTANTNPAQTVVHLIGEVLTKK
jgi:hypothetical protein